MLLALCVAGGAAARTAELCAEPVEGLEETCSLFTAHCEAFLDDPETLDLTTLRPIPAKARRSFSFPKLHAETLGFRMTESPNTSVVYYDNTPACELVMADVDYVGLAVTYRRWKETAGRAFAASGTFSPESHIRMRHAYAAVFLAARRDDGRVTEITMNWNIQEGLTRLKVAYMAEREHTRKMLSGEEN